MNIQFVSGLNTLASYIMFANIVKKPKGQKKRNKMAYPAKTKRNQEIIKLRKKGWSFRKIASHFNINVKTAYRAWKRDTLALVDK